jgi:hypothetical protein
MNKIVFYVCVGKLRLKLESSLNSVIPLKETLNTDRARVDRTFVSYPKHHGPPYLTFRVSCLILKVSQKFTALRPLVLRPFLARDHYLEFDYLESATRSPAKTVEDLP